MESTHTRAIKVLIIGDDGDSRSTTAGSLAGRGFDATDVADGVTALASIEASRPDVVLVDFEAPGTVGFEALKEIRRHAPDLPVMVLTGGSSFSEAFGHLASLFFEPSSGNFDAHGLRSALVLEITHCISTGW